MLKLTVVLLAELSLGACSNSAPPYPPTPTSVPDAPQASQDDPAAKEVYELPKRCAEHTAAWFKRNYSQPQEALSGDGGGSITTMPLEYENHYSHAKNACFAVLSQLASFKNSAHSNAKEYIVVTHTLWDVKANAKLGAYEVKNVEAMTACNVLDATCSSKEQWLELAKPYIAE
jgi:hypothetical protein